MTTGLFTANDSTYWLTRFCFQRGLGAIYFIAFLIALNQFPALCGRTGLLPVPLYLKEVKFWDAPSLFWLNQSDAFIRALAWAGLALSIFALVGYSDAFGTIASVLTWFLLWLIYSSFVNVGQTFYGFGWETLLLVAGFIAIFLGPSNAKPPFLLILALRWLLFRVMFGAGMIKIRGDSCWRKLTCLKFHYETMPSPGPTSWFFARLPDWFQKVSALFNHLAEIVTPIFYFFPRPFRQTAGLIAIAFQLLIISSGNFSWLNHVTIVIAICCFDDSLLSRVTPVKLWAQKMGVAGVAPSVGLSSGLPAPVIYAFIVVIVLLSIRPALNLISSRQAMNRSFDPLHLVNTYGAFGSVTRERDEIILEGSDSPLGPWQEYQFKAKPGDISRMPPWVAPYHFKLDWQMWFAAMSPYYYHPWILNLVAKLLEEDKKVLGLMGQNPFSSHPPKYIRALLYRYNYTRSWHDKNWWQRTYVGEYLPPLSLDDPTYRGILLQEGWLEQ